MARRTRGYQAAWFMARRTRGYETAWFRRRALPGNHVVSAAGLSPRVARLPSAKGGGRATEWLLWILGVQSTYEIPNALGGAG
jgi:hypothetical protein